MAPACASFKALETYAYAMAHTHGPPEEGRSTKGVFETAGRILHDARAYDLLAWLFMRGDEGAFRQQIVDLARLAPGESILDIGCGTGTLAILAKKYAGPTSAVQGVDASPEMIERAQKKAKRAGVEVSFERALVEALPFAAGRFDVVFSTLMLHHLPRPVREQCAREIRRVAKSGARVVVVDFGAASPRKGLLAHFHRHGRVAQHEVVRVLRDAGLSIVESGPMGPHDAYFVVARAS
jgi:ubiquinone/menaquinone biosynthesis C-methylase UbiE